MAEYFKKLLWFVCIILTVLVLPSQVLGLSPVGCVGLAENIVSCWNNGSIEPQTFYYWDGDGLRMANNDLSRLEWAGYDFGIRVLNRTYSLDFTLLNASILSDNATYYAVVFNRTRNITPSSSVYIEYRASQLLNDDYVNLTFTVRTLGYWLYLRRPITLYRIMKDINIDLDNEGDVINFQRSSDPQDIYTGDLNTTYVSRVYGNRFHVGDSSPDSDRGIEWYWVSTRNTYISVGDFAVVWYYNTSDVSGGESFSFTDFWIDAGICSESGMSGCTVSTVFQFDWDGNLTGTTVDHVNNRELVQSIGLFGTCDPSLATFNAGCILRMINGSNTFQNIPYRVAVAAPFVCWNNTDIPLRCDNQKLVYNFPFGWHTNPTVNVTCYHPSNQTVRLNYTYRGVVSSNYTVICRPDTSYPNITYNRPLNNSINVNSTPFVLNCTVNDDYPILNISLWHNLTGTFHQNFTSLNTRPNKEIIVVRNYTNLSEGSYVFQCNSCDNNDKCTTGGLLYFRIVRPPRGTDGIFIIFLFFLVLIIFSIRMAKKRKKENEEKKG